MIIFEENPSLSHPLHSVKSSSRRTNLRLSKQKLRALKRDQARAALYFNTKLSHRRFVISHWYSSMCCSPCVINKKKDRIIARKVKEKGSKSFPVPNGWAAASGRWFSDSPSLPWCICQFAGVGTADGQPRFDYPLLLLRDPVNRLRISIGAQPFFQMPPHTPCHPVSLFVRIRSNGTRRSSTLMQQHDIGSASV